MYQNCEKIADIIDNSITANASVINIYINFDYEKSYLAIIDNGIGMDEETLKNAMKLGSFDPLSTRNINDLGRFGLGLKTASFSQASKLIVASKQNNNTYARCWDLDYVTREEKWEIEVLNNKLESIHEIEKLTNTGTLVLWEKLDKIIETNTKRKTEDIFQEKISILRDHLSLVFHRYLSGEPGLKKIEIRINNELIQPFNPFEGAGKPFPEEEFNRLSDKGKEIINHDIRVIEDIQRKAYTNKLYVNTILTIMIKRGLITGQEIENTMNQLSIEIHNEYMKDKLNTNEKENGD